MMTFKASALLSFSSRRVRDFNRKFKCPKEKFENFICNKCNNRFYCEDAYFEGEEEDETLLYVDPRQPWAPRIGLEVIA